MSETATRVQDGVALIAAERERQVNEEGWTPEHDDQRAEHELSLAAAAYAAPDTTYIGSLSSNGAELRPVWPWRRDGFKRAPDIAALYPVPLALTLLNDPEVRELRIRELVKAGALIAAEIDRLQRIEPVP